MNRKSALAKIKDKKFKQLGEILVSQMRRLGIPGVSVAVWQAGQEFVFIPKGKGVLVMPVPEFQQLAGIAKGARKDVYRDRKDRY